MSHIKRFDKEDVFVDKLTYFNCEYLCGGC